MQTEGRLQALFEPSRIAVIGASRHATKVGHKILANIMAAGFPGSVFPVHPGADAILGLPAVPSIERLPSGLDLAVVCLRPEATVRSVRELAAIGTRAVIVISAGFRETGIEGWRLEEELKSVTRQADMVLLGPNSLGLVNASSRLNASLASVTPQPGGAAFFSQSGALCAAVLDWAEGEQFGFSTFVSLGNKAGLNEADVLAWLGRDPAVRVVLGYVEGIDDGRAFLSQVAAVARDKPVLMVKAGATSAGARAVSAHSGAWAGSDPAYQAAFAQAGVTRAGDLSSLFDLARAFSVQEPPQGPGLAVLANSGGPGVLAADACAGSSLIMAALSRDTVDRLRAVLPPHASAFNPVDAAGDADARRFADALAIVAEDPAVNAILAILTPSPFIDLAEAARAVADLAGRTAKPITACLLGGGREARAGLQAAGVPCYAFPEQAVAVLDRQHRHWQRRQRPSPVPPARRRDKPRAEEILRRAVAQGVAELVEFQALDLLAAYGLPTPAARLAATSRAAVAAAEAIGYPVALKIASPHIPHKTDVDGVRLGLTGPEAVADAFAGIVSRARSLRPEAYLAGCLVQAMAPAEAKEVVAAFTRDEQFGPLVRFGLGGSYGETFKDLAYRLAPLTLLDAQEMAREIRAYPALRGGKGEPAVNFKGLEDILMAMSQLAVDFPEIYEAEFNPVLVSAKGALVADARFGLSVAPGDSA